jgi:hypothetical protein
MNAKKCKEIRRCLKLKDGAVNRGKYQRMKQIIKSGVGPGVAV